MGHGDDHVLAGDQVLVVDIRLAVEISVRRGVANWTRTAASSSADDARDARARAQDVEIVSWISVASFFSSSPISSRPSAVSRCRRRSRIARACASESR
jgi:hypothetical protein